MSLSNHITDPYFDIAVKRTMESEIHLLHKGPIYPAARKSKQCELLGNARSGAGHVVHAPFLNRVVKLMEGRRSLVNEKLRSFFKIYPKWMISTYQVLTYW